jgi:glycosyltransferase involved in cell wall biosynthesis
VQEVQRLIEQGHDVEVLSPGPSAAHHHLALRGWRGVGALAKRVRGYDRVIIQFHPDFFYPPGVGTRERDVVTLALTAVCKLAPVEVRVHEVDYRWGEEPGISGRLFRAMWRSVDRITVHTQKEHEMFCSAMGLADDQVDVIDHGSHFVAHATVDRAQARERLGIPPDERMFLAIGFIQPHKGFDRAVRAFAGLGAQGCRLDVVGSVRVEEPDYLAYRDELRAMVSETDGAHLHDGYVSDELFDVWLIASDIVVLPYRLIWSSSVIERAALFDRRVIVSRVGGLDSQAADDAILVSDDEELHRAMRLAAGVNPSAARPPAHEPWPVTAGQPVDRGVLQAEVRRRAAAARPRHAAPASTTSGTTRSPLAGVPLMALPTTTSNSLVSLAVKRVVRRLTEWQVRPMVDQLNAVHDATLRTIEPDTDSGDRD